MGVTEMVARVVDEARRGARAGSEIDEQAWFDAGEPDTVPNVPRELADAVEGPARMPRWIVVIAAAAIAGGGYLIGVYLAG